MLSSENVFVNNLQRKSHEFDSEIKEMPDQIRSQLKVDRLKAKAEQKRQTDTNSGSGSGSGSGSDSGYYYDTNYYDTNYFDTNYFDPNANPSDIPAPSCNTFDSCSGCVAYNSIPNLPESKKCAWIPDYSICVPHQGADTIFSGIDVFNQTAQCAATFQVIKQLKQIGFFTPAGENILYQYADISNVQFQTTKNPIEPDILAYSFCLKHPAIASSVPGVIFCEMNSTLRKTQSNVTCGYYVLPALSLCPTSMTIDENFLAVGFADNSSAIVISFDNVGAGLNIPWTIVSPDDSLGNFGGDVFLSNAGGVTTLYVASSGDRNQNLVGGCNFYRWNKNISASGNNSVKGTWDRLPTQIPSINYPLGTFQYDVHVISSDSVSLLVNGNADGSQWKFTVFKPCPVGQHFLSGQCQNCPPGQYKDLATIDVCNLCPAGTYNPNAGATNASACKVCPSGKYCPAGSISPTIFTAGRGTSNSNVIPDLQASNALQFETTFFVTAWPYILGILLLCLILLVIACIPIKPIRRVQGWILRGFLALEVPLYFPPSDPKEKEVKIFMNSMAGCFSIITAASMLLVVIFGFIVFSINANQQIQIVLHTQREIGSDQTDYFNNVDTPPMQMVITLVSYSGTTTGRRAANCSGSDNIKFTITGCTTPSGAKCIPRSGRTKNSDSVNLTYVPDVSNGYRNCKLVLDFPPKTSLTAASSFVFDFYDPSFYASHILFNLSTTNDNSSSNPFGPSANWGNGYIYDYITAPAINDVLRKEAILEVSSTINYVESCFDLLVKTDPDVSWLQTTLNNCSFDARSLKEFSPSSKQPSSVGGNDFYAATTSYVYSLTIGIVKSPLWKNTQLSLYVNIGQILVWIILFALGLVGIFQLVKELVGLSVSPIVHFRTKHGGYPILDDEDNEGHRNSEQALELKELKVDKKDETPKPVEEEKKADGNQNN